MDDKHKTQDELLTELESIKDLLGNESLKTSHTKRAESDQHLLTQNIDSPIEIPVLSEMVIEDKAMTKPSLEINRTSPKENTFIVQGDMYKESTHTLNNQTGTSTNENPFLPQHIRDRLTKPSDLKAILAGDTSKIETPSAGSFIVKTTAKPKKPSFVIGNSFLENTETSNEKQTLEDAFKGISDNSTSQEANSVDKTTTPNDEIDRLIDHLIAQYLPKIEAKLRFQLKQSLSKKPPQNTPP